MLLLASCGSCGRPGGSPCRACHAALRPPAPEADPAGLGGLITVLRYEGPARPLVARIKYRNHRQGLAWLALALAHQVLAAGVVVDLVTWAPTTVAHRRARGFDHAELLARRVAAGLAPPRAPERGPPCRAVLRRVSGPAQTGRAAAERRAAGPVFALVGPLAPGCRVLVVDDVVTTGATLRAAIDAVRAGGGRPVPAAVARTPPPPLRSAVAGNTSTVAPPEQRGAPAWK